MLSLLLYCFLELLIVLPLLTNTVANAFAILLLYCLLELLIVLPLLTNTVANAFAITILASLNCL